MISFYVILMDFGKGVLHFIGPGNILKNKNVYFVFLAGFKSAGGPYFKTSVINKSF